MLQQLETRFPPEAYICYKGVSVVSSLLLDNLTTWKANVCEFCNHHSEDIPNIAGLSAELDLWQSLWVHKKEITDNISSKVSES